jgi:GntR family transcriptional repressor for pyruvate dehydrogenase complex
MPFDLGRIDVSRDQPSEAIARALLDRILSGQLKPGTRMPSERELADAFGTGRGPVREALKSLGLLGLLEVRQGDGTYLREARADVLPRVIQWGLLVGEQATLDLVEARQLIEVDIAPLAAQRRDRADLRAIRSQLQGMERARTPQAFVRADVGFHLKIAAASKNSVLANLLTSIQALLEVWIGRVVEAAGDTRPSYEEHPPIYEAIERQDAAAAAAAMESHLTGAAGRLRRALEAHADGQPPSALG